MAVCANSEKTYRYADGFKGAMLKTTAAFTIIEGAHAANILPDAAYVICNLRLSPHDTVESVVATMKAIADRYGLETELMGGRVLRNHTAWFRTVSGH